MGLNEPLLPTRDKPLAKCTALMARNGHAIGLCLAHLLLSMSVPILSDWTRRRHGGSFAFSIPVLTLLAFTFSTLLGVGWTLLSAGLRAGLRQLHRPDMLWRFCLTAGLFTTGDMLSFTAIQRLDAGTFSLVGKAMGMVFTVVLSRLILRRTQRPLDYLLLLAIALGTVLFCRMELRARPETAGRAVQADGGWLLGLAQRLAAVLLTSLGSVVQERLLTKEPGLSFMLQQAWLGMGALATSLLGLYATRTAGDGPLLAGLDDWRAVLLLAFYVAYGLSAGLMVKHLGALSQALCVPLTLGGCYAFAVASGSASLSISVVAAWAASAGLIGAYAFSKASRKLKAAKA